MPSLILREYRTTDKVELSFESMESLSVQELKEKVSMKMGLPLHELKLVYGGRVLKTGKKVVDYDIVTGCTIHVMSFTPKKSVEGGARGRKEGGLMNNKRVLSIIGRVLGNPAVLQDMLEGSPMAGNPSILNILTNPQLLASFSDPDKIQEYIRENPDMGVMMEQIIRQFISSEGLGRGGEEDQEQLVDMFESHLEEEMAQVDREEEEVQRAQAQDQMFEHSQALHAHQQQQQRHQTHHQLPSSASSSRGPLGQGGITQNQLASALANALDPQVLHYPGTSTLSQADSSGPSSLISDQPGSFSSNPPPPYTTSPQQSLGTTPQSLSGDTRSGGGVRPGPSGVRPGPISTENLQHALSNVARSTTRRQASDEGRTGSSRYREQLEQLHLMGITDDTACLHALSATGGDLQAALEILYSK